MICARCLRETADGPELCSSCRGHVAAIATMMARLDPGWLTGETITDEQIRAVRAELPDSPDYGGFEWSRARECEIAVADTRGLAWLWHPIRIREARQRIADVINARKVVTR